MAKKSVVGNPSIKEWGKTSGNYFMIELGNLFDALYVGDEHKPIHIVLLPSKVTAKVSDTSCEYRPKVAMKVKQVKHKVYITFYKGSKCIGKVLFSGFIGTPSWYMDTHNRIR